MRFGFWEIVIILVLILVLFGGKKLPELARGLGKGLREFKKAVKDSDIEDIKSEIESVAKSTDEADDK